MKKSSPVAILIAATAFLGSGAINPIAVQANDSDMGGTKEWTTDQDVDDESVLDEDAQRAQDEAEKNEICIPIGEGENCW